MKTMLRLAVLAVAAFRMIAASPAAIPMDGQVQVRVADNDAGGGG